ncbi:conserved hypothetical protein [Arthrobacter sp. 9V]|uniref:hypothetical protein n=1 Tax=Arthrobacter sp. 9V TaxID=2653132 RepID=UPI0012F2EA28|nr:hypothetical protein [Arthrobacter sp. 9V]VXC42731.1 conserved hypothetical protein [Arthrobacter sp. 9V]
MNSNNNDRDRKVQQDARAWKELTGSNYTTALRQIESPLAQGLLGERISARQLINTLKDHPLIGADGGEWVLGEAGFHADTRWSFDRTRDYVELALITEFLRMFTPIRAGETPSVSSYSLKHTAEKFLKPHCRSVSNGRIIWAAAALGLPMVEDGGLNLLVGVSEQEHAYVRRIVIEERQPRGHQNRPSGFTHLETALEQYAAGELVLGRWEKPESSTEVYPFHEWLMQQAGRDDVVADLAGDHFAGVEGSYHRIAVTAQDLLDILRELSAMPEAFDSALEAIVEWARVAPPKLRGDMSLRTERITSSKEDTSGWGAGPGTIERYEHLCPCGRGLIVEEHDNTPGFREQDVIIECDKCRASWRRVPSLPVRGWRVEPQPLDEAA